MNLPRIRFLPRFPAVLLVPAVLGLWVVLCITRTPYDWSSLWRSGVGSYIRSWWDGGPGLNARGFPFTFYGTWELDEVDQIYRWTGFQIGWFLLDLIIALAAAWGFAMLIDRVAFPLIRATHRRK